MAGNIGIVYMLPQDCPHLRRVSCSWTMLINVMIFLEPWWERRNATLHFPNRSSRANLHSSARTWIQLVPNPTPFKRQTTSMEQEMQEDPIQLITSHGQRKYYDFWKKELNKMAYKKRLHWELLKKELENNSNKDHVKFADESATSGLLVLRPLSFFCRNCTLETTLSLLSNSECDTSKTT